MSSTAGIRGIQGITEDDIADYLANTPSFFERHAELLSAVQLASPHGNRAVSLQERQMDLLRGKIRGLEQKIMEMIRHGQENVAIAEKLHRWTLHLMLSRRPADLPRLLVDELKDEFIIPQAAVRLWGVAPVFAGESYVIDASKDARSFASSLSLPYCGANAGFEAVNWLEDAASTRSLAMIALRRPERAAAFGLLVLASPDPTRFAADMGVEFLMQIGEIAGAALGRLVAEH